MRVFLSGSDMRMVLGNIPEVCLHEIPQDVTDRRELAGSAGTAGRPPVFPRGGLCKEIS